MFEHSEYSEEGRPWFHLGRLPIHSAALLVIIFSASMLVVTLLGATGLREVIAGLALSGYGVFRLGHVWQIVTWPLLNAPSLWFVLSMYLLYSFGRQVEARLGRTGLLKFVGGVALALTAVTLLLPGAVLAGSRDLGFGVFLAFAIICPGAPIWFLITLEAKWWALIFVGVSALGALAAQDWTGLAQLATLCAAVVFILKAFGAADWLPLPQLPTFKFRTSGSRERGPDTTASRDTTREVTPQAEIDRLLDKVSSHGLHSLSEPERKLLAAASDRLQRRQERA